MSKNYKWDDVIVVHQKWDDDEDEYVTTEEVVHDVVALVAPRLGSDTSGVYIGLWFYGVTSGDNESLQYKLKLPGGYTREVAKAHWAQPARREHEALKAKHAQLLEKHEALFKASEGILKRVEVLEKRNADAAKALTKKAPVCDEPAAGVSVSGGGYYAWPAGGPWGMTLRTGYDKAGLSIV